MAKKQEDYLDIEVLKQNHKTAEPVFCGVCAAQGWKAGKMVTDTEYIKAVDDFTGNPMGRRKADA